MQYRCEYHRKVTGKEWACFRPVGEGPMFIFWNEKVLTRIGEPPIPSGATHLILEPEEAGHFDVGVSAFTDEVMVPAMAEAIGCGVEEIEILRGPRLQLR